MAQGKGFGKTILFGEHFVVYGLPGIASAIENTTIAKVEKAKKFEFVDNRPEIPGYKEKKKEEIQNQIDALLEHFKISKEGNSIKITLSGNLECNSGIGASAALASSIARALNEMLGLELNDGQINEIAYKAEEAGTGKGQVSGIDNTCSTFGGFILFEKNPQGGKNKIERLSVKNPIEILLASTGITQETKKVVADVKEKKQANEKMFEKIFRGYKETCQSAFDAIKKEDWETVGKLMDKNQELLREIGVSCKEIEEAIKAGKKAGALGAKLTGTGRGGYVLFLTPGKELQEKVAKAVEEKGFKTLKTLIGSSK